MQCGIERLVGLTWTVLPAPSCSSLSQSSAKLSTAMSWAAEAVLRVRRARERLVMLPGEEAAAIRQQQHSNTRLASRDQYRAQPSWKDKLEARSLEFARSK